MDESSTDFFSGGSWLWPKALAMESDKAMKVIRKVVIGDFQVVCFRMVEIN